MSIAERLQQRTHRFRFAKALRAKARPDLVRLGTGYGGWWVPIDLLHSGSVCYSVGVGEDVSFDLALIDRVGCAIWGIDPTPRSIEYMKTVSEPRLSFLPVGLWIEDTTLRFYAPANPDHVSHSLVNAQKTTSFFEAEVLTLETIMENQGHTKLDLLKLDIEGAEMDVLDHLIGTSIRPRVLCVEFDAPESVSTLVDCVNRIRVDGGYEVNRVDGLNVTFSRRD